MKPTKNEEYSKYNAYIEWTSSNDDILDFAGNASIDRQHAYNIELTFKMTIGQDSKEDKLNVTEHFLDVAESGDFCFVEDKHLSDYLDKIDSKFVKENFDSFRN